MLNSTGVHADYVGDILDEIALEGLDGITTEALWKRLSVRPQFCFRIDEKSKIFIWDIVTRLVGVQFYELPEPRKPLEHYDYLSQQCDHAKAILELDEVYPYSRIKNASTYGSCKHFLKRTDITQNVVDMTLENAEYSYGQKLVIVASQESRNLSLMGKMCPPGLDFSVMPILFDMLEKVGRARHLGIATNGKGSLQSVAEDPKSVHHYLKSLIEYKFVKKQSLAGSLQSNPHASKAYLVRFYGEHANEHQLILQTAIEELKSRPNYLMSHEDFYALFDSEKKSRVKKYSKTTLFRKYICLSKAVPYRTVYPNASQAEWERKSKVGERMIRYFKLIDPNTEVSDIFEKDEEGGEDEEPSSFSQTTSVLYANQPILVQAYNHIKNSGSRGLTQRELGDLMGLNKYYVRAIVKRLVGEKQCISNTEHDGRQQIKRFLVERSKRNIEAVKEIAQILSTNKEKPSADSGEPGKTTEVVLMETDTDKLRAIAAGKTSYRSLKRIGLILKLVKTHRYRVFHQVTNHIIEEEKKEGLSTTVDRRTIKKILKKLVSDGLLKTAAVRDDDGALDSTMQLYMDPAFVIDEQVGQALFHTASDLETAENANPSVEEVQSLEMEFSNISVENLVEMKNMMKNIKAKSASAKDTTERELTYSPKFIRLNTIHELLFYLIYEYTGMVGKSQEELMKELSKTCAIDEDLKKELPRLYDKEISDYMFVPPLKSNTAKIQGWCLMSDFLLRIPLSIFVKISKVGVNTPELCDYLEHPIRKQYLIKDLPFTVREALLSCKTQPFSSLICDFRRLCFMGLLQFGVKFGTKPYQTMIHLNRNATLLDTTTITAEYYQIPADAEFASKSYHFDTRADLKSYWFEMFNICMGTNLGVKECMLGKEILAEREMQKECLKKYIEPVDMQQAKENDNGHLPGDHLGAAGIDSVMFSFLKSNWIVGKTTDSVRVKQPHKVPLSKIRKDLPIKKKYFPRSGPRFKPIVLKKPEKSAGDESKPPESKIPGKLRKVKRREVRCKPAKKVHYDEIDLEALKLMRTLRVTWSQTEDNFLLICKVAMMYQCPNQKTFLRIPYVEIRKALREHVPESTNKTQRAIGRRIVYMLKNPTTAKSVNLCLEELSQIPGVAEKYGCQDLMNRIKPSAPDFQELQKKLYDRFHALVLFMKDRFINGPRIVREERPLKDLIPGSLEEFAEKYGLEKAEKIPLNVKRIREDAIRAILMSSLSCKSEKTSSAVQLFEIYRQYEDDELQNAIRKLHGDGVITISKKANTSIFKSPKYLPLSYSPYQLSFAFQNLINKKYSSSVYSESFDQMNQITEFDDGEDFEVNLNECNVVFYLLSSYDLLSLKPVLPREIIIFDKEMINEEKYSEIVNKYLKALNLEENPEADGGKRSLTDAETSAVKKRKMEIDDEEVVVEEKTVQNSEDGGDPVEKQDLNSINAALYLIREKLSKELTSESGKIVQDIFVVNASKVRCLKKIEEYNLYLKTMGPRIFNSIMEKIISRTSVPLTITEEDLVYQKFLEKGYNSTELQLLKDVLQFIYSKKEFGVTNEDLRNNCKCEILPEIVKHLITTKIVSKSGIDETIYVAQKYSTPWLINSFKMTRLEREKIKPPEVTAVDIGDDDESPNPKKKRKGIISMEDLKREDYTPPSCSMDFNNKVKIIMRPWIRVDGTLNRKALDKFLGMILGFLVMKPGISIKNVMNNFLPDITPVWTKDLIEILYDIGCIELRTHVITKKPSLFLKACVEISDVYTGLEEDDCVAIDVKINALTTLGLFMKGKIHTKDLND